MRGDVEATIGGQAGEDGLGIIFVHSGQFERGQYE